MPPHLVDDAVEEVLLHLPPDDPACLARAASVCKTWRRIVADAAFSARYRAFHGTPPVLAFFRRWAVNSKNVLFVPTTSFRPSLTDHRKYRVKDSRHGVVLLHDSESDRLIVWDPITGHQMELPKAPEYASSSFWISTEGRRGACPCAAGRLLVASLGMYSDDTEVIANACLYSSETGEWGPLTSIRFNYVPLGKYFNRSCMVAEAVYFIRVFGSVVLRYDLVRLGLSVIQLPQAVRLYSDVMPMPAEDGGHGLAVLDSYNLCLWSKDDGDATGWVKRRVIDLEMLLPPGNPPYLIGFDDGANVMLVSRNNGEGIFTVEIESLRTRKVCDQQTSVYPFPYMCSILSSARSA